MNAESFGISQHVLRREDVRLLTGGGTYSDDVSLPGEAHAAFLRAPFGHGAIRSLDTDAARAAPGVLAVYTGDDLAAAGIGTLKLLESDTAMVRAVPPEILEGIIGQIPVGRLGKTDEIAAMAIFLASDEASFCTGMCYDVSGGR